MELGTAVISGLPIMLCALCCRGRSRRRRERHGGAEQIFFTRRLEALFKCQETRRKKKTRKQGEDSASLELGHRPEHSHTSTHLHLFSRKYCSKVSRGYRSYIRENLYALCLRRRCEFASQAQYWWCPGSLWPMINHIHTIKM